MTKGIEWGEAIEVDGKRPEWLGDDEVCIPRWRQLWYSDSIGAPANCVQGWDTVNAIKLPASHPYYATARYNAEHGTSFTYWPGAEESPEDWDGGNVLYGDGSVSIAEPEGHRWERDEPIDTVEIIGYTKRAEPEQAGERLKDSIEQLDAFTPCERTVRMCIEALPADGLGFHPTTMAVNDVIGKVRRTLEALLPKPDRAEELVEEFDAPKGLTTHERMIMKLGFKWLIERGEIKG